MARKKRSTFRTRTRGVGPHQSRQSHSWVMELPPGMPGGATRGRRIIDVLDSIYGLFGFGMGRGL